MNKYMTKINEKIEDLREDCQVSGCGKKAEYNLQSGGYQLYSCDEDGSYTCLKTWGEGDEENSFYCEEHYKLEMS